MGRESPKTKGENEMKRTISVLFALMLIAILAVGICARDNTTVEAAYFNTKPTMDGNFSIEEWGQPTGSAIVSIGRNDYKYDDDDNVLVSDFCFMDPSLAMYPNDISFDFWLRWDEQYFYIGMVSKDKYGYAKMASNWQDREDENKYQDYWNGDVVQFGLDPAGANSSGDSSQPFSSFKNTFVFGYLDDELTTLALRNDANRNQLITGFKGGIKWHPETWASFGGQANTDPGYMVFELAVPYAAFEGNIAEGKSNGFGLTLARVSATPADATDADGNIIGTGTYDCWLSWGDGVMGSLKDQLPQFRCGSNSVILVDTPAVGSGAIAAQGEVETAADAEEPEEAEEPADAEADAEETADAEEETEEAPEDAEDAEETAEETADEEVTEEAEEKEEKEEKTDDAEDPADAEEETEAASGDKAIDAGDGGEEAKSGLPVGAIIGIIAAVVVIAAVVIAVLAKKKK